ncbi:hypothetical protein [Photobacterium alginatilyticum]|uniref:Uncharacterized protein n=1 Tax=Photobacterium alginatilyticum TaxID=1775171 RepID=A0ABW9YQW0_9GAMM|nr:hypothetical protein [Photobacterium alginatilyticum]NBI55952.1 hypothetical protein [Photobacterium alginatilyticum]
MHFNTSLANAKLNQTLLVDAVGLCYVIAPPHRALNGDPGLAKDQYKNKYWADRLLRTHCSSWGYQFNLYRLYHQLCPSQLQHHKSKDEIIDELSNRMAHGEFLVFCVDNLLPSPPDATNADVPMASSSKVEPLQPIAPSRNLEQGGKDLTNNDKLEVLDISCSLPNGKPAVNIPYTVKTLSCGTVHKGELDNSGTQHFDNLQAGDVEVIFGKPITEAEIVTTRNQIGFLLKSIIAAQNAEALALETEYQKLNSAEKWLKRVEQRARGVFDAGAGMLESIATNYSINSMLAYLTRIYIAAWQTNDTVTDNWVTTFADNYLEQHHKELVIALGFDPAAINKEMFAEAYEVASFVNSDPATQNALIDFAKDYVAAQHELEWNYIAGSAIFEIVLTALLASSTGGIGAAGSVPSKARHISKFSELGTLLKQLTKQLKQKAQFKQKRGRTNGHITHQIKRPDGAEVPSEIKLLKLDAEWFEQKAFSQAPHAGLHNRDGLTPNFDEVAKSFETKRKVDMDNLSLSDSAAREALETQDWKGNKVEEILSSGEDSFRVDRIQAGEKLYGFTTKGFNKEIPTSAYWADEAGFLDVKN